MNRLGKLLPTGDCWAIHRQEAVTHLQAATRTGPGGIDHGGFRPAPAPATGQKRDRLLASVPSAASRPGRHAEHAADGMAKGKAQLAITQAFHHCQAHILPVAIASSH